MASSLKAPPLQVNGNMIENTMEKAEALQAEILNRFSVENDLDTNPLQDWSGTGHLK